MLPEKISFARIARSCYLRVTLSHLPELIKRQNMEIPIGKLFVNEVMKSCVEMVRVLSQGCGIE